MVFFLKPGKIVVVLQGRQAGKKAVIVKNFEKGTEARPYPHAIIFGIQHYPKPVYSRMRENTIKRRSRVIPFVKVINLSHIFPTRYSVDGLDDVIKKVTPESLEKGTRENVKRYIRRKLQQHYTKGNNTGFYAPLRF